MATINSNATIVKVAPIQFGKLSKSQKEFVYRKLSEKYPNANLNSTEPPAPDVAQDFKSLLIYCLDSNTCEVE